ncbi:MAG: LON peptidase substrate-binding domain-containing protein, partial [Coprobacter sp.]|nr:LON peptidase substrate-binding domain-containing protein [Coprobacter sp.]
MKNFFNDNNMFDDTDDNSATIMPIFTEITGTPDTDCSGMDLMDVPVLPLRNMVMYPGVALPVSIGRAESLQLVKESYEKKRLIGVTCQKEMSIDHPVYDDLYPVGTVAEIVKILEMPDSSSTVILQGKKRFYLENLTATEPYLQGNIVLLEDEMPAEND